MCLERLLSLQIECSTMSGGIVQLSKSSIGCGINQCIIFCIDMFILNVWWDSKWENKLHNWLLSFLVHCYISSSLLWFLRLLGKYFINQAYYSLLYARSNPRILCNQMDERYRLWKLFCLVWDHSWPFSYCMRIFENRLKRDQSLHKSARDRLIYKPS